MSFDTDKVHGRNGWLLCEFAQTFVVKSHPIKGPGPDGDPVQSSVQGIVGRLLSGGEFGGCDYHAGQLVMFNGEARAFPLDYPKIASGTPKDLHPTKMLLHGSSVLAVLDDDALSGLSLNPSGNNRLQMAR